MICYIAHFIHRYTTSPHLIHMAHYHRDVQLQSHERGTDEMNKLSDKIQSGAKAFLVTEYKYLSGFVLLVFAVLLIIYTVDPPTGKYPGGTPDKVDGIRAGGCFLAGAFLR